MDRKIIIGVVAVVIIGILIWIFGTPSAPTPLSPDYVDESSESTSQSTSDTQSSGSTQKSSGSVLSRNVLPNSGNHECVYESSTPSGSARNVIYLADGKMRGEFRSKNSSGVATNNLFVYDGVYLYVWTEGMAQGTRTNPASVTDLPETIPAELTGVTLAGEGIDVIAWDCHLWIKDASLLAPPSYVTFTAQ